MKILMVAAENGALPGGKVGGMGDVLRDAPLALAEQGHSVDLVTPGYGHFSRLPGARKVTDVVVAFRGRREVVEVFRVADGAAGRVVYWALEHPLFSAAGAGKIYCDDPPGRPFATDANRFALFSVAVAEGFAGGVFSDCAVIHLHDWHTALVAVLARYHPRYRALAATRLVYSIHNLSLQGIRPFRGDDSSLASWFPELACDQTQICDPRYPDCINPMRAAINLCHRIHAVSPTYAREIQQPSVAGAGFVGGEGLERDLQLAASEQRLAGILNGCDYSRPVPHQSFADVLVAARRQLLDWIGAGPHLASDHFLALRAVEHWQGARAPELVVTSVGRLTDQKVRLFRETTGAGNSCLDEILAALGDVGVLVVLGSGDPAIEGFFTAAAARHSNLIFLRGYSEYLADHLYAGGDLFVMPSSFEPCGISQMLAMRAGQPCLVHGVGGLADTVSDRDNGFVFGGASPRAQADAFVAYFAAIVRLTQEQSHHYQAVRTAASQARFPWSVVVDQYLDRLYT